MKITPTIKKYVEERVSEIYELKIEAIWAEYRAEETRLNKLLNSLLEKANTEARDILITTDFVPAWGKEKGLFERCNIINEEWKNALHEKEVKIRRERHRKIENIIISLELDDEVGDLMEFEKKVDELLKTIDKE